VNSKKSGVVTGLVTLVMDCRCWQTDVYCSFFTSLYFSE